VATEPRRLSLPDTHSEVQADPTPIAGNGEKKQFGRRKEAGSESTEHSSSEITDTGGGVRT
jgi:hypothetical protein